MLSQFFKLKFRHERVLLPALLVLVLGGCLPTHSLYPVYTESTIVFDEQLLGTWAGDVTESGVFDEGVWVFSRW